MDDEWVDPRNKTERMHDMMVYGPHAVCGTARTVRTFFTDTTTFMCMWCPKCDVEVN